MVSPAERRDLAARGKSRIPVGEVSQQPSAVVGETAIASVCRSGAASAPELAGFVLSAVSQEPEGTDEVGLEHLALFFLARDVGPEELGLFGVALAESPYTGALARHRAGGGVVMGGDFRPPSGNRTFRSSWGYSWRIPLPRGYGAKLRRNPVQGHRPTTGGHPAQDGGLGSVAAHRS